MDGRRNWPYYDTLDIFRRFYPKLLNHTLGFLSDYFQIDDKPSHDAFDDIKATAGLLRYAMVKHIAPNTAKRRAAMAMYLRLFAPLSQDIDQLRQASYTLPPAELLAKLMQESTIKSYYETHDKTGTNGPIDRIENIRKLYMIAKEGHDPAQSPRDSLHDFLMMTSLSNSELDSLIAKKPQIPIITIHQAKGLEFDYVFLASMQDGTFPLSHAQGRELEEEKRLFYVAITRAKKKLYLTWHHYENQRRCKPSPFLQALPAVDILEMDKS